MSLHQRLADPLYVPPIFAPIHADRSDIIAAAYASDMSTAQFEELVAALYPEEDFQ